MGAAQLFEIEDGNCFKWELHSCLRLSMVIVLNGSCTVVGY